MTSINAIRFDEYSGMTLCDEERGWNEEGMRIHCSEKIKPIIDPVIQREAGLVAAYGNTGTSSIGDELKFNIKKRILEKYKEEKGKSRKIPKRFMTIEEISYLAYDTIVEAKRKHIDEQLLGRYNFTANDFIQGFYMKGDKRYEITEKEIISDVEECLTWTKRGGDVRSVFLNAGIVAGFEPEGGFRIFHLSMIEHFCEPVQIFFLAEGSGLDQCNVVLVEYASAKTLPERKAPIDRCEAAYAIIAAVNQASRHNLGVGGYLSIILFDGRAKNNMDKMVEINDDRAKLASEIVWANRYDHISQKNAHDLLDTLLFRGETFEEAHDALMKKAGNPKKLRRLLRGYKN